jgi:D-alanine-D-alanine ligase
MKKLNVGILFGGKSGEHEVSIVSALSVYHALDKQKYNVTLIGIDPAGRWLLPDQARLLAQSENPRLIKLNQEKATVSLLPYTHAQQLISVDSSVSTFTHLDVIFPVLHGTNGEDGTVQGLLELAQIPFIGSGVLGSALCMDKEVSRRLLKAAGIPVVPSMSVHSEEYSEAPDAFLAKAERLFGYPYFVKPVNMGSSVGVHKVKDRASARKLVDDAFQYDLKVLFEKGVAARELECSVLGNETPRASIVGEIIPRHEFYSYEAKYMDDNGAELCIPAKNLSPELAIKVRDLAILAFKVLDCRGLARVDFFLDRETGELFLNELNTLPGFTKISMYPKLWEASGLPYSALLDELIQLALTYSTKKAALKTSYEPQT